MLFWLVQNPINSGGVITSAKTSGHKDIRILQNAAKIDRTFLSFREDR